MKLLKTWKQSTLRSSKREVRRYFCVHKEVSVFKIQVHSESAGSGTNQLPVGEGRAVQI